jgi:hypothetical protein
MADDERRDETGPDLPDPSSDPSGCPSAAECRRLDLEQLRQGILMAWKEKIDAEIAWFKAAALLEQVEQDGNTRIVAEADQVDAGLRDAWRQLLHRLRRLRSQLRRLQAGDEPDRTRDPGPAAG